MEIPRSPSKCDHCIFYRTRGTFRARARANGSSVNSLRAESPRAFYRVSSPPPPPLPLAFRPLRALHLQFSIYLFFLPRDVQLRRLNLLRDAAVRSLSISIYFRPRARHIERISRDGMSLRPASPWREFRSDDPHPIVDRI